MSNEKPDSAVGASARAIAPQENMTVYEPLDGELDYTVDPLVRLSDVQIALRRCGVVVGQNADGTLTMTRLEGVYCWCGRRFADVKLLIAHTAEKGHLRT